MMRLFNSIRKTGLMALALILFVVTACSNDGQLQRQGIDHKEQRQSQGMNLERQNGQMRAQSLQGEGLTPPDLNAHIAIVPIRGENYISLDELVKVLQLQSDWDNQLQTYRIGDNDVAYELKINSLQATKEEDTVQLSKPPVLHQNQMYIPVAVLADLFQEEMTYEVTAQEVVILPSASTLQELDVTDETDDGGTTNDELDFADDPNDPFKQDGDETSPDEESSNEVSTGEAEDESMWDFAEESSLPAVPVASLKNINMNGLIRTSKKYLGVKYKFNAGPYAKSKRFDCSSFTQYVYGKYGVKLPRVSRSQATKGVYIGRKNLRKGDLLFFYVPGRFKSNKTVGHVGIYIGNSRMIHSSPSPKNGVQITNINKAYWKRTFLRAKRVAY